MENPADQHICSLIEDLATLAGKWTTTSEQKQELINQIAQLRSSMNPTIIQKD
jgi:hypothetical protein